jgi:hypothetical protein
MRRKRRNHKPAFKAKVALAALKGDRTLSPQRWDFPIVTICARWDGLLRSRIKVPAAPVGYAPPTDRWNPF